MNWIKFKLKDEIDENTDCIWSGELPSNGEKVFVSDGQFVKTDIWSGGENAGLENYDNYHQQFLWWAHLPQAPTNSNHVGWQKIKSRPLTEEERDMYPDSEDMFDCNVPDADEHVLVSDGKWVDDDTWVDYWDGTVGFEFYNDTHDDVWWRSMPEPPKSETKK